MMSTLQEAHFPSNKNLEVFCIKFPIAPTIKVKDKLNTDYSLVSLNAFYFLLILFMIYLLTHYFQCKTNMKFAEVPNHI